MRIFLFALLLGWALPGIAQNATIAEGTHVNLRAGKTDNYRVIRVLSPGTPVEILEITQDMAKAKTKEGEIGWLPARLLIMPPMDDHPPTTPATTAAPAAEQPSPMAAHADAGMEEQQTQRGDIPWRLLLVGALCFVIGAAVGIGLHEAYYRKRLNGLRI